MITNVDGYKGNNCYTRRYITGGLWAWSAKPTWVGNGPYSCPSISGTSQVSGTSRVPQLPHCLSSCVPAIVSRSHRIAASSCISSALRHNIIACLWRFASLHCLVLPALHITSLACVLTFRVAASSCASSTASLCASNVVTCSSLPWLLVLTILAFHLSTLRGVRFHIVVW